MLACRELTRCFGNAQTRQRVLDGVSFRFRPGKKYVLLGPSGSGKTTLLSILGCMLSPCQGQVEIGNVPVRYDDQKQLSWIRREQLGFVFQHAQLLPFLTVEQNLAVVGHNLGMSRRDAKLRSDTVMGRLGISHLKQLRPAQASGGERQRIAIARAIFHRPAIILADEPTAALDWETGKIAIELLTEVAQTDRSVLITVTHDTRLVPMFDCCLEINAGKVAVR